MKTKSKKCRPVPSVLLFMGGLFMVLFLLSNGDAEANMIHVDDDAAAGGNGSSSSPFATIAEAVDAANQGGGDVIKLAPGLYEVTSTVKIDKPLEIRGSNQMTLDANGWPTGQITPGTETRIVDTGALAAEPVIAVGASDRPVLFDVTLSNFSVQGGFYGILITRAQNFAVKDCLITNSGFVGLRTGLSSGEITRNYVTAARAAGIITEAGNAASPAIVTVSGNRSIKNGGGFLAVGTAPSKPEFADFLNVIVRNNDFSQNTAFARSSFGIRVFMIHLDLVPTFSAQETGNVRAVFQENRLSGNQIGIVIDAGFAYRQTENVCERRVFSGTFDITLQGNDVSGSLFHPAIVTFTRINATVDPAMRSNWQYLHRATFRIDDPDQSLGKYRLDHPEQDPFSGKCKDKPNEVLGNTLLYNGEEIPNQQNLP